MCGNKEEMESFQCIMLDYDNYSDFEKENKNPFKHLNIKYTEYWKNLITVMFADESLRILFETLKEELRESYFTFAISCISKFVQINFTGPELDAETEAFLASDIFKDDVDYRNFLTINNEDININVKHPCLLVAAKSIFKNCKMSPLLNMWWQWRGILIHQKIIDELSPTLLSNATYLQKDFQETILVGNMKALFEIEQAQLYIGIRGIVKADKHIKQACEILGLKYELTGKLGKRTKHQEKELAQLSLEVTLDDREMVDRQIVGDLVIPTYVNLNDDVRLDTIKFSNTDDCQKYPNTEQKLLLTIAQYLIISKPQDDLYYEEIKPFIDIILSQNNTWCVRAVILFLRSKLEAKHNRTIERSLAQVEEIIKATKKPEPHPLARVGAVYSTGLQPLWRSEAQYADLMLNLGLVKASLEIYMRLQLWEEVIVCFTILKNTHKAAEIIKTQLELKPTVKLYCLLGDTTFDVSCYEKAWEFSKRRSHRAQRHWANHYFQRKQYEEAIPHFEKSVSINPLQGIAWLRLGFAALETQNWQVAATAYRRYTTIEPDGFEAWNNLAQAYIKLGNKRNAHQALQDALRCNFDNWKVWENFLIVSADISNYSDVIRAYHKLLDLKEKYLDVDVLKVLVYGVCNEVHESDDKASNMMIRRTRELLGRITAIYPGEGSLWELYASVAPVLLLKIQRLQRAYRGYTQGAWIKDVNNCKHVLYVCLKLGEAVLDDTIPSKDTVINSVRLNISAAISIIKKLDYSETKMLLQEVTAVLARIIEKSKNAST